MDRACSGRPSADEKSSENTFKIFLKKHKTLWLLSAVTVLASIALQNYTVNQYVRAFSKLTIMRLIDLNDFGNLLHDSCLMYKELPKRELIESDCYTCESIDRVPVVENPEENLESYTELDWPIAYKSKVVTNVSVRDVALALLTGHFIPCDYKSNLRIDPLRTIDINIGWFMHWRNCDDVHGKTIRSLYRPDSFLSISTETWTIMSFMYNTIHYKNINTYYDSRVAVSQISGFFDYQLMPRQLCNDICKPLKGRLEVNHTHTSDNSDVWYSKNAKYNFISPCGTKYLLKYVLIQIMKTCCTVNQSMYTGMFCM